MALQSMTGFARHAAQHAWPTARRVSSGKCARSMARGLIFACAAARAGIGGTSVRSLLARHFSRGNFQASLTVERSETQAGFAINQPMLAEVLKLGAELQEKYGLAPASVDGILALRGIIDQSQGGRRGRARCAGSYNRRGL
ncbi:YicC-like family, N-terminal region [Brucella melitensis]|nr:YicC-like family, N-terminal region [Brucella melitensis]